MQELDPLARRMGAINTIVVQADGSLKGFNNDGFGYIQSLLDARPGWPGNRFGPLFFCMFWRLTAYSTPCWSGPTPGMRCKAL